MEKLVEWLLEPDRVAIGISCILLIVAVGALYRDNTRLREELTETQEKRVADAKESIKALGEFASAVRSLRELTQGLIDEMRSRGRR